MQKQRDIKRIRKILHLLETQWLMEDNQLKFFQMVQKIAHKVNPEFTSLEELSKVEDDKMYQALFELYVEDYDKRFNTKSNLTDAINLWSNCKSQKFEQMYCLYESLSYEEILENIKNTKDTSVYHSFYIKLLMQYVNDNYMENKNEAIELIEKYK